MRLLRVVVSLAVMALDPRSLRVFSRSRECLGTRTGRGFQGTGVARL